MSATYLVFMEKGGDACDEDLAHLYQELLTNLQKGTPNIAATFSRQVFDQQWTDCLQVQELHEWQCEARITQKASGPEGSRTGRI